MSRIGALSSVALVGALLTAAAAYAAHPSWSRSDSGSRMMSMGPGMTMPTGQMQEMMEQCQQMMQRWMKGSEGHDRPQEEVPQGNSG